MGRYGDFVGALSVISHLRVGIYPMTVFGRRPNGDVANGMGIGFENASKSLPHNLRRS